MTTWANQIAAANGLCAICLSVVKNRERMVRFTATTKAIAELDR